MGGEISRNRHLRGQRRDKFAESHCTREVPPLGEVYSPFTQKLRLRFSLDPFSDHIEPQRFRDPDDVVDDLTGGRLGADCSHECLVDLEIDPAGTRASRERLE